MLAAKRLGRRDAVGRAVRRDGAALASVHHAGGRQLGDGVHGVLGGVGRALADLGRTCSRSKPLLLAAASSLRSSIFRLAPRRWSRKLLAPSSNQRPIASNTPGCFGGASERSQARLQAAAARHPGRRPTAPAAAASRETRQAARGHAPRSRLDPGPGTAHGDRPANARNAMAKLRLALQNKYSAATMPTTSTTAPSDTQNPSRSSMMARAWGP